MALRVWGGAQEQAPRAGPKAAGRLGKHQPTQPEAEGAGVGIRRLQHVGVASVESRAGPHVLRVSTPKNPSAAIFAAHPAKTMARVFMKKHNCKVTLKRVHEFAPLRT